MRAFNIKFRENSFVSGNPTEVIEKLSEKGLFLNEISKKHIEEMMCQERPTSNSFAAGNNSGNPIVYIKEVTALSNDALSNNKLEEIKKYVAENYPNEDLRPNYKIYEDGRIHIELGMNWYWSSIFKTHLAVHEFGLREQNINVENVKRLIDNFVYKNK
ncbi:hypothetical protein AAGV28_07085 [Flavobacterium sp. FZUC8N2.13]|uniref:Uncharacterized protein n=1 Tax=Flavobacterium zubiriense TaxID=3138075 RepID=A0ABV4TDY3_9FLAO